MRNDHIPSFRSFDGPLRFTSASGGEGRCYLSVYERKGSLRPTTTIRAKMGHLAHMILDTD